MKLDREKVKQNEQKDGKSSVKTMTEKEKQEIRDIVSAYNNGDNDLKAWAIEEMVRRTNGFIGTIINKHFEEFKNEYYGDLHAEGVVAIIENMGGLHIDKGTITTYFTRILIHAMSEFLHSETSRSTPYYANIMRKIKEAQKYYESQHITATVTDISLLTGLSVKKVEDGLRRIQAVDAYYYGDEEGLDSVVNGVAQTPEHQMIEKERTQILANALTCLTEEDRKIVLLRFGFEYGKEMSYNQIAKKLHLPVNQVMNSLNRSLRILHDNQELKNLEGKGSYHRKTNTLNSTEMNIMPDKNVINIYADIDEDLPVEININVNSKKKTRQDDTYIISVS